MTHKLCQRNFDIRYARLLLADGHILIIFIISNKYYSHKYYEKRMKLAQFSNVEGKFLLFDEAVCFDVTFCISGQCIYSFR